MVYHEGILVSSNGVVNTSAAGAEIKGDHLYLMIYHPSDTSRNLKVGKKFTFSLTKSPELFYKASLTGLNKPEKPELQDDEMVEKNGYHYPKEASKTYFCEVVEIEEIEGEDEYGEYSLDKVTAEIKYQEGEGDYLTRKDPYVDSLVYASRAPVAGEKEMDKIREKVKKILENEETELARKIISYVEGDEQ